MIGGWLLLVVAIVVEAKSHNHVVALLLLILAMLTAIGVKVSDIGRDLHEIVRQREERRP